MYFLISNFSNSLSLRNRDILIFITIQDYPINSLCTT